MVKEQWLMLMPTAEFFLHRGKAAMPPFLVVLRPMDRQIPGHPHYNSYPAYIHIC